MFLPRLIPYKLLVPSLFVAAVLASAQIMQAKSVRSLGYSNLRTRDAIKMRRGGCAAFGHSCFGGHGKRSDSIINSLEAEQDRSGLQPPADDVRAFIIKEGFQTPIETFNKDQFDNDLNFIMPSPNRADDYLRFSPLFRKWLANSYRSDLVAENN